MNTKWRITLRCLLTGECLSKVLLSTVQWNFAVPFVALKWVFCLSPDKLRAIFKTLPFSCLRNPASLFRSIDLFSLYILFSHFRPRDVTRGNSFFQMSSYARANLRITNEKTKGKFPWGHHMVWNGKTKCTSGKGLLAPKLSVTVIGASFPELSWGLSYWPVNSIKGVASFWFAFSNPG